MASEADRLQAAIALHQQGRLAEAENRYRQILAGEPDHFDALHMLGVIRHQQGHGAEALELIERALKSNPDSARALSNLGLVLYALGRPDDALASFDRALMVAPDFVEAISNRAQLLYRTGCDQAAISAFDRLLALRPDHAEGFFLRGNALARMGRHADAVRSYDSALKLRPNVPDLLNNRGNALEALRRYDDALASYDAALRIRPDFAEAHNNRASLLATLSRPDQALAGFERVLALQPDHPQALNNRGNTLCALGRHEEALASYERALAIRPDYAEAISNCGIALSALGRHEEALAHFDRAVVLAPRHAPAWYNRGNALSALKCYEEALASYEQALALVPDYVDALDNRGNTLLNLHRYAEALASFDRALALSRENPAIHNNRGSALNALKHHDEALASYEQALVLKPDFADAHSNRADVLKELRRYDEAIVSYERALAIDPEHVDASVGVADAALSMCDWARTATLAGPIAERVRAGKPTVGPFTLLAFFDDPELHRKGAETFVTERIPVKPEPVCGGSAVAHEKIRVAYLSADFRRHATAYLMAGLFERHDRSRFDIIGVAFDVDDGSEMRRRLVEAFDEFHDVGTKSDRDVARLLHARDVDIAVDLKGHTGESRLGIFAHRGAPIQVNYLGYPGTIGADFIDYIIADPVIAPLDHAPFFAEKIVQLPDCYQVNDRKRAIAQNTPTRSEAGLPVEGIVFCCFNNSYKITAAVFNVWMRLMRAVPTSVLWLLRGSVDAQRNLCREAQARGVDPARLVFAGRSDVAEHLARHRLADLFLDTLPYNAHTTASDALWAGVPVLTCQGSAFAGRVGASLLRAIGLPELVTQNLADYEALALQLATDPALLGALRRRLAQSRLTCPLFDTDRFRRHVEAAYTTMWDIWRRGEPPRSFAVDVRASDDGAGTPAL